MYQLKNKKVLITAGPTWTSIDKVRVISNIFKGTLGLIIANEAVKRGAKVTLLLGPGETSFFRKNYSSFRIIRFKFFEELYKLMKKEISSQRYDIVIHSAAVSDYRPVKYYKGKIKSKQENLIIEFKPTVKIVDQIKKWDPRIFLVKFKLEVNLNKKRLIERTYESMLASNADLIVANDFKNLKDKIHKAFIINMNKNIISCNRKEEIAKTLLNIISSKI